MAEYREDIQVAVDRLAGSKFGIKKELKNLPLRLFEGEQVLAVAGGQYGKGNGLLVLTDERMLFVNEGFGSAKVEDFAFDRISSIEEKSGMMTSEIKVFASGNDGHIKGIFKADATQFADAARKQLRSRKSAPAAQSAPQAAAQPAIDPLDQLQKLAGLRDAGIITADEFETKKSALMALV